MMSWPRLSPELLGQRTLSDVLKLLDQTGRVKSRPGLQQGLRQEAPQLQPTQARLQHLIIVSERFTKIIAQWVCGNCQASVQLCYNKVWWERVAL